MESDGTGQGEWLQCRDGQLLGPFGVDELRERARRGELTRGDLISRQGELRWISALSVVDLHDFAANPIRKNAMLPYRSRRMAQAAGAIVILLGVILARIYKRAITDAIEQLLMRSWGQAISLAASAAVVVLLLSIVIFAIRRRMIALQEQLDPQEPTEIIRRSGRPPVLYLRSFEVDSRGVLKSIESYEHLIRTVFAPIGPLIGIGRPGERLQSLGAARLYVGDDWQEIVHSLMRQSSLVILRIGETEGFWWEVEQVASRLSRENILFFLPQDRDAAKQGRLYQTFRERANPLFDDVLPTELGEAEFLGFNPDGQAHPYAPTEARWLTDWLCGGRGRNAAIYRQSLAPLAKRFGVDLGRPASSRDCLALPFVLTKGAIQDIAAYAREQWRTVKRGENRLRWAFIGVMLTIPIAIIVSSWMNRPVRTKSIEDIAREAAKKVVRDRMLDSSSPGFHREALKKSAEMTGQGIDVDLHSPSP